MLLYFFFFAKLGGWLRACRRDATSSHASTFCVCVCVLNNKRRHSFITNCSLFFLFCFCLFFCLFCIFSKKCVIGLSCMLDMQGFFLFFFFFLFFTCLRLFCLLFLSGKTPAWHPYSIYELLTFLRTATKKWRPPPSPHPHPSSSLHQPPPPHLPQTHLSCIPV